MTNRQRHLQTLFEKKLKPHVRAIDTGDVYLKEIFHVLGEEGYFSSANLTIHDLIKREIEVVEEASAFCMTTGFIIWCQLAALTYVRNSENTLLKEKLLPDLEQGQIVAGTGLSNPMKYYAGLEKLHLKAKKTAGGYLVHGTLPSVSNLGEGHWFGAVAEVDDDKRIMVFVPCEAERLTLKEKKDYLGINGSGTYACQFDQVFIPDDFVLSEDADTFVNKIRPYFLVYQIPLGLGVTKAALLSIDKCKKRQNGCNEYLPVQFTDLEKTYDKVRSDLNQLVVHPDENLEWGNLIKIRKNIANLTLDAVHGAMLHGGGSAYLQNSPDARRLREAYFLVNLTPTMKHLEKMIQQSKEKTSS